MNKFESFACGQIFHSYPEDKTYQEIIELCLDDNLREKHNDDLEDIENEDQQLILCEQYQNEWWENIPDFLDQLKGASERHFKD